MFIPKLKTWHQNVETATLMSVCIEAGSRKVMCKDEKDVGSDICDFSVCLWSCYSGLQIHSDHYLMSCLCTVQRLVKEGKIQHKHQRKNPPHLEC